MSTRNIRVIAFSICLAALFCAICADAFCAESRFGQIDEYVARTPASAKKSINSLADYLIKPAGSDVEKARAIFSWITHNINFDMDAYDSGIYGDQSPATVLKTRTAVCDGYSNLFNALAKRAGVESVTIDGCSRGRDYQVGSTFTRNDHSWNAVKIDGSWRLLDCIWGAGYIDGDRKFVRKPRDYYFLTDPTAFVYDHFPQNPSWQLLDKPITKSEFESLVYIRPAFFSYNLKLASNLQGTINCGNSCSVELVSPDDVLLAAEVKRGEVNAPGASVFVQRDSSRVCVNAIFPTAGEYILRLYAKRADAPGNYDWAADYCVKANPQTSDNDAFPTAFETFHQKNAHLYEPMRGCLKSGSTQTFRITAPEALAVAVIIDGKWVNLQKTGSLFEGQALIRGNDVQVAAMFPGNRNYLVLLKYTVT
ncbi:MAG: transglutaminase domain-containing protein [Armatimonadota bacterium]